MIGLKSLDRQINDINSAINAGFSVCICHYNMSTTIESTLVSVTRNILVDRDEIIVLDDGSNPHHLQNLCSITTRLCKDGNPIKLKTLKRSHLRKLGAARNESIALASKQTVVLHVDADDTFTNGSLQAFFKAYCIISVLEGRDIYLSGNQIQITTKRLVSSHPYPNIYYTEDRYLWAKLSSKRLIRFIKHKNVRHRSIIRRDKKLLKVIKIAFYTLLNDLRVMHGTKKAITSRFALLTSKKTFSRKVVVLVQLGMLPLVYAIARCQGKLSQDFIPLSYSKDAMIHRSNVPDLILDLDPINGPKLINHFFYPHELEFFQFGDPEPS